MAEYLYKTRGNSSPKDKPRVYFTCHPNDFERSFDKICEDIFKTHDCAVYYTKDMSEKIPEQELATDLGSMNLFVIPVSFRLLSQPNRAMDHDFAYAKQEHIPVLPIMLEPGLDAVYARPDKFGEKQYLDPYARDLTQISYEEKLKKYLEAVLISDEMVQRVRAAFDAYIFLSYRKKDRRYANKLMRLIHNKPQCRDIAIWYDEFLTPGESFNENIEKMLRDSKLFTLLVTPNLLEEPDGKPNFVMAHEYPMAKEQKIPMLSVEMEPTDRECLLQKFDGIPVCTDPSNDEMFHEQLLQALKKAAITTDKDDPEHTFLMGLAYLDGIDMETDRKRGLELITAAAEADLPEAIKKLGCMFCKGTYVELDYQETLKWVQKLVDCYSTVYGEYDPYTLRAYNCLACTYGNLGNNQKAIELYQKIYDLRCDVCDQGDPELARDLVNIAQAYTDAGKYQEALTRNQEAYEQVCKTLPENDHDAITALNNLASAYSNIKDHKTALALYQKAYDLGCKVYGEEDVDTLSTCSNIACTLSEMHKHQEALKFGQKAYDLDCRVLGERHPQTLTALCNLACIYSDLGEHKKALELQRKAYKAHRDILGKEHPGTLDMYDNIASILGEMGKHRSALKMHLKAYAIGCNDFDGKHDKMQAIINNIAEEYRVLCDYENAKIWAKKLYELRCKIFGNTHMKTLRALYNLAYCYSALGDNEQAICLFEKVHDQYCAQLGRESEGAMHTLYELAHSYYNANAYEQALQAIEVVYAFCYKTFGEDHPNTRSVKDNLELVRKAL